MNTNQSAKHKNVAWMERRDIQVPFVLPWPPAYSLKKHPRAKHVRFRASIRRGLQLIVPYHFNVKKIPALFEQNRLWIEKQLLELNNHYQSFLDLLPQQLEFQALKSSWKVQYLACAARLQLSCRPHQQELVLVGDVQDKQACKKKLLKWIKDLAKLHLPAMLERISQETGLTYQKVSIRDQATRWGSCSRAKAISLNYKLLFLPPHLVSHTILHELCHTVFLNHADKFWQLLAKYDPHWQQNRRAIRKAGEWIPKWLP